MGIVGRSVRGSRWVVCAFILPILFSASTRRLDLPLLSCHTIPPFGFRPFIRLDERFFFAFSPSFLFLRVCSRTSSSGVLFVVQPGWTPDGTRGADGVRCGRDDAEDGQCSFLVVWGSAMWCVLLLCLSPTRG